MMAKREYYEVRSDSFDMLDADRWESMTTDVEVFAYYIMEAEQGACWDDIQEADTLAEAEVIMRLKSPEFYGKEYFVSYIVKVTEDEYGNTMDSEDAEDYIVVANREPKGFGRMIAASNLNGLITWEEVGADKWIERCYSMDGETHRFYCTSRTCYLDDKSVEEFVSMCEAKGFAVARK